MKYRTLGNTYLNVSLLEKIADIHRTIPNPAP